jgi:hypothetical protein
MPCSLCGDNGHNRRTCRNWPDLEASRQEEEEPLVTELHTPPSHFTNIRFDINYRPSTRNRRPVEFNTNTNTNTSIELSPQDQLFQGLDDLDFRSMFNDLSDILDTDTNDDDVPDLEVMFDEEHVKPVNVNIALVDCVEEPCQTTDCPICMEDLKKTDLFVSRCGHQFHSTCMVVHLKVHDTCPMCRGVLFTPTAV